jgi:DDE superfamily endonuclease
MPRLLSERKKGNIEEYAKTHSVRQTAKQHQCSCQTVKFLKEGKQRRDDMDEIRKRLNRKKSKKSTAVNERRRIIDRLLQQEVTQSHFQENKKTKSLTKLERKQPKYPSAEAVRRWFQDHRPDSEPPSLSTITRDAHALGYTSYVRDKIPFRPLQQKKRKAFCSNNRYSDRAYVRRLIFSDEHSITNNDNSSHKMWAKKKSRALPRQVKSKFNAVSSMFWSAIGYNYKGPIVWMEFKETRRQIVKPKGRPGKNKKAKKAQYKNVTITKSNLNTDRYIEHVLKHEAFNKKLKNKRTIFMQDGARPHTSIATKNWLARNKVNHIDDWPANSPDLNPIEQVWADLNREVAKRGWPGNVEDLKRMVEDVWKDYPMSKINNYVMSFVDKCRTCVRNQGGLAQ